MKKEVSEVAVLYYDMIYKIAFTYLKSEADAEDIVQDVFVKYIVNTKEFKDEEHEKKWLIRVVLNLCKNLSKSAWKRNTVPIECEDNFYLRSQEQEDIFEELDNLKEKYKKVVQLFYYEDYSIQKISKILGISESNVRTRLKRARIELKIEIEKGDILK